MLKTAESAHLLEGTAYLPPTPRASRWVFVLISSLIEPFAFLTSMNKLHVRYPAVFVLEKRRSKRRRRKRRTA